MEKEIQSYADPARAHVLQRFFKTGKGEYGEGDVFIGITVPVLRSLAKKHLDASFDEIGSLLKNKIHECRLVALEILVMKYERAVKVEDVILKKKIATFYLKNKSYINNWDLVDASAPYILGDYLKDDPTVLYTLAGSKNMWNRRISIISTLGFIRCGDFTDTITLAEILLGDQEDLIHKAVGWMLREVGKRDISVLKKFLKTHVEKMPRTMLRYAIEKFPERERLSYLDKR